MAITPVSDGGTGRDTLSGIIKGEGTSPVVQAADGTDYLSPASILSNGLIDNAAARGLLRMHESEGLLAASGNTTALQAYADNDGDWRDGYLPLYFPAGGYLFDDSIDWAGRTGIPAVHGGGGEPIWHAENAYEQSGGRGGLVTRMVWGDTESTDKYNKAMWELSGLGGVIAGVHFQGKWKATDQTALIRDASGMVEYPYPDPGGTHTNEDRCMYAMKINSIANFGSGKHIFPHGLSCMLFQTALLVTDTPGFSNHGDQCHVMGRTAFYFCDIGFHNNQLQAFLWTFHHIDAAFCTYPLLIDRGGKLVVDILDIQSRVKAGLYIRGSDSGGVGPGIFILNYVNIDETAPVSVLVLQVEPAMGGASAACTYINTLHINNTRSLEGWGAADYTETDGSLNGSTGKFTPDDNLPIDKVAVGDYAFIRVDGATSPQWVSRVTAVTTSTFDVSTATLHGGALTTLTGNCTVHVYRMQHEKPIARIVNSYGTHRFSNVNGAFDRCIHVSGGNATHFPTIVFENSRFTCGRHLPEHPEAIFSSSSRDYVQLIFRGNTEATKSANHLNGGRAYEDQVVFGQFDGNGNFTVIP